MSLEVGQALQDSIDDLTSERGALFVAVFIIFGLVNTVVGQSLSLAFNRYVASALDIPASAMQQSGGFGGTSNALGLDLPLAVAGLLAVALWPVGVALRVVVIRSFAIESPDPIPAGATKNLLPTVAVAIVVSILTGIAIGIGTVLLIIPGLVLAILFYFVMQEVALNESGIIESITNSIDIVGDNIGGVVVLLIVTFVLGIVVTVPLTMLSLGLPSSVSSALSTVLSQIAAVFGIAVSTNAYQQAMADQQTEEF